MKTKSSVGGFTLAELLVVIATTAMLVALVLPSLAMSRDRGQGARCLSNLRQLTTAWLAYTSDNQGKLVPNGGEDTQPSGLFDPSHPQWCPGRQDSAIELSPDITGADLGGQWIRKGLLYPYVGNEGVYKCPADTFGFISGGLRYSQVRSVSMNPWLGPLRPFNNTAESYYKVSDLVRPGPSQLFVFIDENPWTVNDSSFICLPGGTSWIDCPATYHNGGSGLSFADGHAEIHRWQDGALAKYAPPNQMGNSPSQPPLQNPPTDLNWLEGVSSYVK